jgi:hypothetical protein
MFNSFAISVFVLHSFQVYPTGFQIYFIRTAVLLASLALIVQFSLVYNQAERASVLYNFILVFFKFFYGLIILFIMPAIFE